MDPLQTTCFGATDLSCQNKPAERCQKAQQRLLPRELKTAGPLSSKEAQDTSSAPGLGTWQLS